MNPAVSRLYFPRHGPRISAIYFFDNALHRTDNLNMLFYTLTFRSQSYFTVALIDECVQLLQPFDPTNTGGDTLARGTEHHWNAWRTEFFSKPQNVITYAFNTRYGRYYENDTRLKLAGEIGYRFQPYVSMLVNASFNDIRLPEPWGNTKFWLVGS